MSTICRRVVIVSAVLFVLSGANTAFAATRTSNGTGGGIWSVGSTWAGGVVPATSDTVIIASGDTVSLSANLNQSGVVTINSGGTLTDGGKVFGIKNNLNPGMVVNGTFRITVSNGLNKNGAGNSPTVQVNNGGVINFSTTAATTGIANWAYNSGSTASYSASGNQTLGVFTYNNVTLSGSGTKSMASGISIGGTLSVASTGTPTASIGAGTTLTVANLTLGGLGRINGTWGSTSSTATYKNNTYFAATTGKLSVTNDTRATPTLSVTNSPVTYTGSAQAATVTGSVPGAANTVLTGGAATQTNGGSYAVTANFVPTDTTSYTSLTAASAGTFTINPASQTITFNPLPNKTLGEADFAVSATASSGLAVSFSSLTAGVCTVSTATVHLVSIGTCTIRASQAGDSNYTAASNVDQSFVVATGAVASLTLTNPGDMYAKTRLGYTVSRFDSYGNAVGTGTTTVYLYTTSTGGTQKFYDDSLAGSVITSIAIGSGHSTANVWYYDETPGSYTITASDATPVADGATGITDATDAVTVMPVATKFVILPPTSGTVDAPITVTVQAQKPDTSVDTNYQSDVTLATTGSATGGGLVDIINGVGTLAISDTVAETAALSLSDSESTGLDVSSTQSLAFTGGVLAQFSLSNPSTLIAGERAAYTVTRKDQYGNVSSSATSTVYLYSSSTGSSKKFYDAATGGAVISSVQIVAGQSSASVWYYDTLPGSWSITASDNASAPDGTTGVNDAVQTLGVVAGPTAALSLNDPGDMTVDTRIGYTVTRKDQFNNLATSGSTNVYLYSNSVGTSSPAFYDAASLGNSITSLAIPDSASSASFWYEDPNLGTWNVTVSDATPTADGATGVADASDAVAVNAAPIVATRFVILPPVNGTVDAPITVTVQAQDGSGNVDTSYESDVTLSATGTVTGTGLVNIVNGVGTLPLSDTHAGTRTLSLADSQGTGLDVSSTQPLTFAPGAVAQFSLDNPGDSAAGVRIGYTVTRKDQYGNLVTTGATDAYLYSSSTGVNKKFYDSASGGSAITSLVISNGNSSGAFWAYDEKAGNWFITVSDNATAPDASGIADASDAIAVQPATVAKFLLNDPGNMTAGTRLGYTVTREDQYNNLVTTGVTLAYFYSSSTGTTTAFYAVAVGGAPTTFATINDGSSSGTFWYYDETPGTWLITASDNASAPDSAGVQDAVDSVTVSAIPIVATRLVILPPASVQVGTPAIVTVEAQDENGNVDTTIVSGVTLRTDGSATGAGLVTMTNGVGTISLSDTVAETVTLSLSDTQSTGLDVSSTQSLLFSAIPVVPVTGVSGGGTGLEPVPAITGVQISGRAFPNASVQVLAVSPAGATLAGQATARANGSFSILLKGITVGIGSYGIVGVDDLGRTTQIKAFNANYTSSNALLALDTALSPTLGLVRPTVRQNDTVGFIGMAVPGYTVSAQVDGKAVSVTAKADADGAYKILYPTGSLSLGSHTVRVRQTSPSGVASDFAPQKVFTVTTLFTPQTDFNQDGVINVQDWSIFLSRWSSSNKATQLLDDLNGDGKVDVTDLSIFVRTLKK
ncbi:MAG: hypothetical protein PHV99_00985 [Candidatus Pacebacteria bacterium]|nr:hypothetical protein [Candidatus Paceibacterota bacterium]